MHGSGWTGRDLGRKHSRTNPLFKPNTSLQTRSRLSHGEGGWSHHVIGRHSCWADPGALWLVYGHARRGRRTAGGAMSMGLLSLREVAPSIAALRATASKCVPKYAGQFPSAAGTDETAAWWHLTPTERPRPRRPSRCFIDGSSMLCRPLPSKLLITHARAAPAPRLADKSTRRQSGGACALLLTAPACCHGDELIWACERRPISTLRRTEL